MTPEQTSRQPIDRRLEQAGWIVQDYRQMNISTGLGVAVREFPLTTGDADYMLYADAKAIGVVEAKPKGHTLTGVETQSGKYLDGLPKTLPNYRLPLPFAYTSTARSGSFTWCHGSTSSSSTRRDALGLLPTGMRGQDTQGSRLTLHNSMISWIGTPLWLLLGSHPFYS